MDEKATDILADDAELDPAPSPETLSGVHRGDPEPSPARKALVDQWIARVRAGREKWKPVFKRMREDQEFAAGKQWPADGEDVDPYTANITLRHVNQRTAQLYAKNPKAKATVRERIDHVLWDGTQASLQRAVQSAQMGDPDAEAIIREYVTTEQQRTVLRRVARTLELLYEYNIDEQPLPFKTMMKLVVRRAVTTGVGYVKLGFQRATQLRPDVAPRVADITERLREIERLASDMAAGELDKNAAEAEQLRLELQALKKAGTVVVREGLVFDYPSSTSVIVDPATINLRTFLGTNWLALEYMMTPERVRDVYNVDITATGAGYTKYTEKGRPEGEGAESSTAHAVEILKEQTEPAGDQDGKQAGQACVWEIYDKTSGLVFVVCDGYPDFLQEPAEPDVWTERFWPVFPLVLNEVDDDNSVFPPSDVRLMRDQQMEFNRSRQALRLHRIANKPKTIAAGGMLDEDDREKLRDHPANALIELTGLQPGQRVEDLLQAWAGPPIDPNLYQVNMIYEDVLRVVGVQEANLGGTAGATATETSIAESSRQSSLASNIDDLDQLLTDLARAGGQILMAEVSPKVVAEIVGKGAVWPTLSRQQLAREIFLEVEAGSTGRPNQAREVQIAERIFPMLLQLPGVSPEFLARELLRRLDDKLQLTDALMPGLPSIMALNGQMARPSPGGSAGGDPGAQGPRGANPTPDPNGPPPDGVPAAPPSLN